MTLFTSAIEKVRQERAEIDGRITGKKAVRDSILDDIALLEARKSALDFALAVMEEQEPEPVLLPHEKAPRMDIAQALVELLSTGVPRTVYEASRFIERRPSVVSAALTRLSEAGKVELVEGMSNRYRLVGNSEAAQAAAE